MMAERPGDDEIAKWHRFFAVECNNSAWNLIEREKRTSQEDMELLHCAQAAAFHWDKVGTATNVARADLLLAHAHAKLGNAELAAKYAQRNLDFVTTNESSDWELAFAHAAFAHAAAIRPDAEAHANHYWRAQTIGDSLGPKDKEIFMATFRHVPQP